MEKNLRESIEDVIREVSAVDDIYKSTDDIATVIEKYLDKYVSPAAAARFKKACAR